MSEQPIISVIMSTYNEEEDFLRVAVESILNQTYRDFEFLIGVDNPNNASLIEILRSYADEDDRISIYINEENMGLAATLNKLIDIAKGRYIARMDADDKSEPTRLEKQLHFMEENNIDLTSCGVNVIDEQDNVIQKLEKLPATDAVIRKKMCINNCVPHPGWMVKRDLYIALGGYESTPYCEDYELLLKARLGDWKFGNLDEMLLSYRMTTVSISRSNLYKQYLSMKYCQEKYVLGRELEFDKYMDANFDETEEVKYNTAANNFTEGLAAVKTGKLFSGLVLLLKSFFGSRCYRDKLFKYVKQML
ncbi:MAG: glycosyltransferase [Lachnospiraceae bacterium]|nr:glycosyltransferase [Lachnospiraceae bacterium]